MNNYLKNGNVPGELFGFRTQQDIVEFTRFQIKRKGFFFRGVVGTQTIPITLSGDAQALIGICIYDPTGDARNNLSLVVNNLTIIEQVSVVHLCRVFGDPATFQSNPLTTEIVPVPMPLSGSDAISIEYTAFSGGNIQALFLYV